ncbi:alginate lyase family protein [Neobacillus cucumis]|nr:alginate lyase family protein [Neobacillus cucumis]
MKVTPLRVIPRIKTKEQMLEHCEGYFNDIWYTSERYGKVSSPYGEMWSFKGPDRSWRFQHHSLASVSHLVDGFILTNKNQYLEMCKKIILNWYEVNYPVSPSDMGWHDHSTAWRLINISRFFVEWKELPNTGMEEVSLLTEIVEAHCKKLADPDFYMPKHNHGLDQDMALFTGSVIFNTMKKANEWESLALERFQKQLDHLFGKDGSYLEHSPHYVYLLLKNLYSFLDFIYQIDHISKDMLTERLESVFKYMIYILMPDGVIPPIGDSENATISPKLTNKWKLNSSDLQVFLEKLVSQSSEIEQFENQLPLDAAYMDAGVVALRNKWNYELDTTQIIMYCGFHSRVHKHYDDLSFVLFNNGLPLITEGGKYSYEYQSAEREYMLSPLAHNSVMVDGRSADIFAKNVEKSGLLSNLLTKNISYVSGMHALYQNVNHRRIFVYFKPDILVVIDKLDGVENHTFDTCFNLHWDLDCIKEKDKFYGYLNGIKVLEVSDIYSNQKVIDRIISRGEVEPLKGWLSPNYGEIVPNSLIQYRTQGRNVRNIFQISLGNSLIKEEKVQASWEENQIKLKWKSYTVDINLTDFYEHLYIKDKYYRTNKIVKPEVIEGITYNESKQFINIF